MNCDGQRTNDGSGRRRAQGEATTRKRSINQNHQLRSLGQRTLVRHLHFAKTVPRRYMTAWVGTGQSMKLKLCNIYGSYWGKVEPLR